MKRIVVTLYSAVALVSGCAVDDAVLPDDEALGTVEDALENSNAQNPNGLCPNGLYPGVLDLTTLSPNALTPEALSSSALAAIQHPGKAGDMSRQLLSYTVGCALGLSQSFSFTWRDSANVEHSESFPGLLGLADDWASKPLTVPGQRWVSACLASRANWYEHPVMLSSRGGHSNLRTQSDEERAAFTREEGAFFGNLFLPIPAVYACYVPANADHSRSLFRDCAAGHIDTLGHVVPCGPITLLGSCADHCQALDADGLYHPSCANGAGGESTFSVITTFLM
jgi:hypothetical protein